ncbi:MAG: nucleotidyltransferase family protein [Bacteroidales bacterium]
MIEQGIGNVGDWPSFFALARRHRVFSLVAERLRAVRAVPAAIEEQLRGACRRHAVRNLQLASEARRLTAALEAEGIACAVLKGGALSMRAYGQPLLRDARDVDLLVAPHALSRAGAVLAAAGLRLEKPAAQWRAVQALFRRYSHEYMLSAPSGVVVELKTRLHPTGGLMPVSVSALLERRVRVSVAGLDLPGLADEDLLPYLCGHGARHCWFRLKWLADIAALATHGMPSSSLFDQLEAVRRLGGEVAVLEALLLAHDWLGADIPEAILVQARAHPLVARRRMLVEAAVRAPAMMPFADPAFERMADRSEYLLRADAGYRLAVLERHLARRLQSAVRKMGWATQPPSGLPSGGG